jgi:lipopolysaccharide/colanic/teichoic acid biosynthesis glycosyltransferase
MAGENYIEDIDNISEFNDSKANSIDTNQDSNNSMQDQLYRELKLAVKKHHVYLHRLENIQYVNHSKLYLTTKRLMDVSVGLLGLILFSPLFLIVALLIKLDSQGPAFFSQMRVGKNGRLFKMYKFRTMVVDAEKKTGPVWAKKNDPRLTFVGRFLRDSKIDELPQFLNLVYGEMSMVGPRPERPYFVDQFDKIIPGYSHRLEVTPGLTGPAQLRNGYDGSGFDVIRKLRYDAVYLKKMSLSMDTGLLIETFISALKGRL